MKILLWFVALLALAVGVTFVANANTGYVLFIFAPYQVQMSLNLLIILLIVTAMLGYGLIKFINMLLNLPGQSKRKRLQREQAEAKRQGYLAGLFFIAGKMPQVERAAEKALLYEGNEEARAVIALTGARAAHAQRNFIKRDAYLEKVNKKDKDIIIATLIAQANMLFDERRDDEALECLKKVYSLSPKLIAAMRLELRIQQRKGNTARIIILTDKLEKLEVFDSVYAERIRYEAYIVHITKLESTKMLNDWWHALPSFIQQDSGIILAVSKALVAFGEQATAIKIVTDALEYKWDVALLDYFGRLGIKSNQLIEQLKKAEEWLKIHPQNAELLLVLGRLCIAAELWGKAQHYLQASLAITSKPSTHAELGYLLDRLGNINEATQHYQRSVE